MGFVGTKESWTNLNQNEWATYFDVENANVRVVIVKTVLNTYELIIDSLNFNKKQNEAINNANVNMLKVQNSGNVIKNLVWKWVIIVLNCKAIIKVGIL